MNLSLSKLFSLFVVVLWANNTFLFAQDSRHAHLDHFDLENEFPNYLLPERYRHASTVPDHILETQRDKLEKSLKSVFDRLLVPISDEETGETKVVRYFEYVTKRLKKIDSQVQIIPSGGVVRSAISYIYDQMYSEGKTLDEVIADTSDISSTKVRGIGSDFDIFIRSPGGRFYDIQTALLRITNSAEMKYEMRESSHALKRAFFTIGDVKDFDKHLERSVAQGGSTLDFLGFDFEKASLLEPRKHNNIVNLLIRGHFEYVGPSGRIEDQAKQTVRGFRPMLELPWIQIVDPRRLEKEVDDILKGNVPITGKTKEQFTKMLRNSRYSGAHNRFYRSAKGSLEKKLLEIARKGGVFFPEFIEEIDLGWQMEKYCPPEVLVDTAKFLRESTNNGSLYHGTPSMVNAMSILRQGLFVSSSSQGTAAYGRGAYSSRSMEVAKSYAKGEGVIFELEVSPRARILDISKSKARSFLQKTAQEAKRVGVDHHLYLTRKYGIDLIVTGDIVLIQNGQAINVPNGLVTLLSGLRNALYVKNNSVKIKLIAFEEYRRVLDYMVDTGQIPSTSELVIDEIQYLEELLKDSEKISAGEIQGILRSYLSPVNFERLNFVLKQATLDKTSLSEKYIFSKIKILKEDEVETLIESGIKNPEEYSYYFTRVIVEKFSKQLKEDDYIRLSWHLLKSQHPTDIRIGFRNLLKHVPVEELFEESLKWLANTKTNALHALTRQVIKENINNAIAKGKKEEIFKTIFAFIKDGDHQNVLYIIKMVDRDYPEYTGSSMYNDLLKLGEESELVSFRDYYLKKVSVGTIKLDLVRNVELLLEEDDVSVYKKKVNALVSNLKDAGDNEYFKVLNKLKQHLLEVLQKDEKLTDMKVQHWFYSAGIHFHEVFDDELFVRKVFKTIQDAKTPYRKVSMSFFKALAASESIYALEILLLAVESEVWHLDKLKVYIREILKIDDFTDKDFLMDIFLNEKVSEVAKSYLLKACRQSCTEVLSEIKVQEVVLTLLKSNNDIILSNILEILPLVSDDWFSLVFTHIRKEKFGTTKISNIIGKHLKAMDTNAINKSYRYVFDRKTGDRRFIVDILRMFPSLTYESLAANYKTDLLSLFDFNDSRSADFLFSLLVKSENNIEELPSLIIKMGKLDDFKFINLAQKYLSHYVNKSGIKEAIIIKQFSSELSDLKTPVLLYFFRWMRKLDESVIKESMDPEILVEVFRNFKDSSDLSKLLINELIRLHPTESTLKAFFDHSWGLDSRISRYRDSNKRYFRAKLKALLEANSSLAGLMINEYEQANLPEEMRKIIESVVNSLVESGTCPEKFKKLFKS